MNLWKKSLCVTIQMKALEQYFPALLFINQCKVTQPFEWNLLKNSFILFLYLKKTILTWVQHNSLEVIVLYPWTKICFLEKIRGLISLSTIEQKNFWDWRWSFLENVCQACIIILIKWSKEKELRTLRH